MMIIVRFLMSNTMIIVIMEELVTIATVKVVMMTYRWNIMEKEKQKTKSKLELIKKFIR